MQFKFLGTAASEGIPNPFCACKVCTHAREVLGVERRTRASAIIDGQVQIDMSPEWSYQLEREHMTARDIHTVLFTHTHPDHFNVGEFVSRCENFGYDINEPLHVYGNDCAIKGAFNALDNLGGDRFLLKVVAPYMSFENKGYKFTAVLANHARMELCYNYLIEKDDKTIFYGLDSGFLPESSFEFLKGKKIDLAILECTYATYIQGDKTNNHLNFDSLFNEVAILRDMQVLDEKSKVYASHVSHSSQMTHCEIENLLKDKNINLAYDGLTLEV